MSLLLVAQRALTVPGWAKDALWRRAQAIPSLDLRFADNKSLVNAVTGASLITFTRASTATFIDSSGVLQTASTDVPRFDHNPTTGESLGLLVEEQRTNLLLNSGTLSTQSVTVTAAAHTLSFTGTGTITLTGTSTAGPLVGTGTGEGNRVSLTFTPTAGTLTLTVSGTVSNAQLELGSFRTSYISTTAATATRSADVASITGSNFTSWYRQDEGTVYGSTGVLPGSPVLWDIGSGGAFGTTAYSSYTGTAWAAQSGSPLNISSSAVVSSSSAHAIALRANDVVAAASGGLGVTDTSCSMPTSPTTFTIGKAGWSGAGGHVNSTIRRLTYWPVRLGNNVLQQITQ